MQSVAWIPTLLVDDQIEFVDSVVKEFFEILVSMNRFDFIEFGVEDIVRSGFVKEYIIAKEYA